MSPDRYSEPESFQQSSTLKVADLKRLKEDASVFIETGTNLGHGVQVALDAGFERVITFETNQTLWEKSVSRFRQNDGVELILGDSRTEMLKAIKDIEGRMLFWLDGHSMKDIPLIEELDQIKALDRNDHIILIDDVRMMDTEHWDYFKKSDLESKVMEINSKYAITYIDTIQGKKDIMVIK